MSLLTLEKNKMLTKQFYFKLHLAAVLALDNIH